MRFKSIIRASVMSLLALGVFTNCHDVLDEAPLNTRFNEEIDYSNSQEMILPLIGTYADFYSRGWETIPLISVRGDDVDNGGQGDQQDFDATDKFQYNKDYWMYNSLWQLNYSDIYNGRTAIQEIEKYRDAGGDEQLAAQYAAEVEVLNGFLLYYLAQVWGDILIPETANPSDLFVAEISTKNQVMQYISDQMDRALPNLVTVHPAERTDVPGGVNRYTALAIKARANQEMGNYDVVAQATSEIINSGVYQLYPDYYELFKTDGKLSSENLLELQYSDYGTEAGPANYHLHMFYGPQGWTPAREGAGSGWGFYEPTLKFIDFMLDRGESVRLETSVLFSPQGIQEIRDVTGLNDLPDFVSNVTRDGDQINDYARANFASGKHYLPSVQLTPGRNRYGESKNIICIRYAEILLMHAEAVLRGGSNAAITPEVAVNLVRERANMPTLDQVSLDDVAAEKFAELSMEWGIRYYDLIRTERFDELNYGDRTFNAPEDIFLPYPQNQVDLLPALNN